eukprot:1552695-Rhodomonas_salina.1
MLALSSEERAQSTSRVSKGCAKAVPTCGAESRVEMINARRDLQLRMTSSFETFGFICPCASWT